MVTSIDVALIGLAGSLIGGFCSIGGALLIDARKRGHDRRSVASILAAEISGVVAHVTEASTKHQLSSVLAVLEQGRDYNFPALETAPPEYGPIFERNIEKLGLLPPEISSEVVKFYGSLVGFRAGMRNLFGRTWEVSVETPARQAAQIRALIGLLDEGERVNASLVPRLHAIARTKFSIFRTKTK